MEDWTGIIERAASIVREAEIFVITAGAGMGVDSGLPDFRGDHGFWKAYPAYDRLGLSFAECATPMHFSNIPPLCLRLLRTPYQSVSGHHSP
jgi:NAD-dependent SIR2 family protein deacetylase